MLPPFSLHWFLHPAWLLQHIAVVVINMPMQKIKLTGVMKKMHLKRTGINVCDRPKLKFSPPSPNSTLSFGERNSMNELEDDHSQNAGSSTVLSSICNIPSDIPKGFFELYAGGECKRYVIPLKFLKHQVLQSLLNQAEEEFGYSSQGPIKLPCDTAFFDHLLSLLGRHYCYSSVMLKRH